MSTVKRGSSGTSRAAVIKTSCVHETRKPTDPSTDVDGTRLACTAAGRQVNSRPPDGLARIRRPVCPIQPLEKQQRRLILDGLIDNMMARTTSISESAAGLNTAAG